MTQGLNLMVWNAARGGMRSVVEAYRRDGFLDRHGVRLFAAYVDGGIVRRQIALAVALLGFTWTLLSKRVRLVHIHAAMRGSFWRKGLFASIARRFGVPVLLHLHGSEFKSFYAGLSPKAQRRVQRHLERAAQVLVLSESWRSYMSGIAPAAQVVVVPNYVAVPAVPARDPQSARRLLFLGLIGERKGVWDLISAFAPVHAAFPDARLAIGGNGEVDKARAQIAEASLSSVIELPGWVSGDAREQLLATSGIYVLPSYNEGLPMSVLEAMAHGLAVVTTRVGGIPELITDEVDGLLVDPGDRNALAAALGRLLGDEALRARLQAGGRERIEARYSDEVVLPLLDSIYAQPVPARMDADAPSGMQRSIAR